MPFLKKSRERRKIDEKETRSWALSDNGVKGIEKDFTCLGCDCFSTVENRGMPVVSTQLILDLLLKLQSFAYETGITQLRICVGP